MGLSEQASADFKMFVEDADAGFGVAICVTNPDGKTLQMTGYSTDVSQTIDPDTGIAVSGRTASVVVALKELKPALGLPRDIADSSSKPWLVKFDDILGCSRLFKVTEALPDLKIGAVVCLLEVYRQ